MNGEQYTGQQLINQCNILSQRIVALELENQVVKANNSELTKSVQQLKELNASKDRFFSIIAHDLKNPLNSLLGFTELMYTNLNEFDNNKITTFSRIIYDAAREVQNLLDNLLEWSRIQRGVIKIIPEKLNIKEFIDDCIDNCENQLTAKQIQIENKITENLWVYADPNMIQLILRNLMSNAIKFNHINGFIQLKSQSKENFIEISFIDSGIGIKKENFKDLFIFTVDNLVGNSSKEKGTGLGLVLCKEFVELNGGKITVESETGNGSSFTFSLPRVNN